MSEWHLIDDLLLAAHKHKASDLIIRTHDRIRMRIHGSIITVSPDKIPEPDREQLKSMIAHVTRGLHTEVPIEQMHNLDLHYSLENVAHFRLHILRTHNDFGLVARVIPQSIPGFDELRLPPVVREICGYRSGLVLMAGATGSGKSTVAGALLRLWEYEAGRITLGGHELRGYRTEAVRDMIALAPQRSHLFNTTVRENLRLARPDADDAALAAACTVAQIHDEIAALPDGYDTYVGEAGAKFSGGQVRRIAIARALLRNAPITILDEPTEGLDAATEQRLLEALFAATAGRTLVIITHRPAGLDRMDAIAVMENGRIVERGTHATLARDGVRYRRLYFALD